MSKLIVLLAVLASESYEPNYEGVFCAGYAHGYHAAYCYGHTSDCMEQPAPIPECPNVKGSWRQGYDRGFSDGMATR